jgi:hypothetical protein
MKPMSASEVLKQSGIPLRNRFEALGSRNNLAPVNTRDRSNSVKRKASAEINEDKQKKANLDPRPVIEPQKLDEMEKKVVLMKGISTKISEEAAKVKLDPGLETIIRCICEFTEVSAGFHEDLMKANTAIVSVTPAPGPGSRIELDTSPDSQLEPDPEVFISYSQVATRPRVTKPSPPPTQPVKQKQVKDPKIQAFQDAVKHAERSTIVFNLNLGSKKTLNEKTILSQATLALSAAAATVEGSNSKVPSGDVVATLDDVMSVTQNVTLLGKVTKPYENRANPQDPKNKTFFTMPIKYEFKDKETRVEVETILRDTCKIDCTTPYPANLRSCMKQVVDHFRADYPEDYIKVAVDTQNLTLRVSRRVKGDGWYNHKEPIPLPELALDIRSRFAPKELVMKNLPTRRSSRSRSRSSQASRGEQDMELQNN